MTVNRLKEYLNTVPIIDYYDKRVQIIEECKITPQVFRNWKNGITEVPELAKPIINQIAGKEVFEV
jgi:hypothetical protein